MIWGMRDANTLRGTCNVAMHHCSEPPNADVMLGDIKSSLQVTKQLLRASIDESGGAFVKGECAEQDSEILAFEHFAATLPLT